VRTVNVALQERGARTVRPMCSDHLLAMQESESFDTPQVRAVLSATGAECHYCRQEARNL
jgi:hypothetical protein